jgi:phosphoglycerate dehydrogenase-like enzyme
MYRILITDYQWPSLDVEREILRDLPGELIVAETGEEPELIKLAPQADAILTCWKHVTAKVIDAARKCRIITRYGVGLDNIAVEHATRLGIPVTYSPTYCLDEVAEHAIGLLFALERRIVRFDRAIRGGSYPGVPFRGMRRIAGRALGLLGYGNIARAVAKRARGLGLRVLTHDPVVTGLDPEQGRAVSFEQLLAESDYLSLHAPFGPSTRGIINAEALARMKPGAFLINTARGGLVELDAVLEALEQGRLEGAALDVYPDEPPDLKHPLFRHERFIATPHAAFYSEESVAFMQRQCATQVKTLLSGGRPEHIVNPDYRQHPPRY